MSSPLSPSGLWLLLFAGLVGIVPAIFQTRRIIEFPFMMGGCLLVWILPQAYFTYRDPQAMTNRIFLDFCVFASVCVLAGIAGYYICLKWGQRRYHVHEYCPIKSFRLGVTLCCLGSCGYVALALHGPVEGLWTGWPVYFITLAKLSFVGVPLILISHFKSRSPDKVLLALLFLLPVAGLVVLRGRRSPTFELLSFLLVFGVVRLRWAVPRLGMLIGLGLAMVVAYCFPVWRQTFATAGVIDSIQKTSVSEIASQKLEQGGGSEFRDGAFLFDGLRIQKEYHYGLDMWDRLVQDYVPGNLLGYSIKDRLKIFSGEWDPIFATAKSLGHTASGYTAKTGFVDAFREFGWYGPLLFAVLGFCWARFTRPVHNGDDTALHFLGLLALDPAFFVYTGIILRLSGDLVAFVLIFLAARTCTKRRFVVNARANNAPSRAPASAPSTRKSPELTPKKEFAQMTAKWSVTGQNSERRTREATATKIKG